MLVDTKSDLYFDFLQFTMYTFVYESFILFYKNKFQFSIETYVESRGFVLASPPLYIIYLHCRKIHNLFVRALETGRKVNL